MPDRLTFGEMAAENNTCRVGLCMCMACLAVNNQLHSLETRQSEAAGRASVNECDSTLPDSSCTCTNNRSYDFVLRRVFHVMIYLHCTAVM